MGFITEVATRFPLWWYQVRVANKHCALRVVKAAGGLMLLGAASPIVSSLVVELFKKCFLSSLNTAVKVKTSFIAPLNSLIKSMFQ